MIMGLLTALAGAHLVHPNPSACAVSASQRIIASARETVSAMDLMQLRDIGSLSDDSAPFAVSPDGVRVAVAVREAVAEANSYCTRILVIDLRSRTSHEVTAIEGGVILERGDLAGKLADFGSGVMRALIPQWSPDGKSLAYLEKRDGIDQVMIVPADGSEKRRQLTNSEVDVLQFQWGNDASQLEYVARSEASREKVALEAEGRRGFHYDDRWVPMWKFQPFTPVTQKHRFSVNATTGAVHEVPFREIDLDTAQRAFGPGKSETVIRLQDPEFVNSLKEIQSRSATAEALCRSDACATAEKVWMRPEDRRILFLRKAGWSDSLTQIVRWDPVSGRSRVVVATEDNIGGCRAARDQLLCAIDGTLQPRRLESIDYDTGRRSVLLDPNPEWVKKQKGKVRNLRWRNSLGLECFAKLILPKANRASDRKLPLIIVGYQNRGFARGGSGDFFPILPFVGEGYAVLYYQLPYPIGFKDPMKDWSEAGRRGLDNWADYQSFQSAIEIILSKLDDEGVIDRDRVGITGFSAGTARAMFTLSQGRNYRAASFIGCCGGPISRDLFMGPLMAASYREMGYPSLRDDLSKQPNDYDLAPNVGRVETPILVQSGDREFLAGLQSFDAFRQNGKTFDLYVYPDEFHIFWQPIHRLAAYARNLAWFDQNLLGKQNEWAHEFLTGNVKRPGFSGGSFHLAMQPYRGSRGLHSNCLRP
ncbi:dipeptidyl aminopeptidase/acylaminoacyl peptidase, partial [Novosphingobium sp. ST904]